MKEVRTQCLVVGSGVAGLTTAIEIAEKGQDVLVISAAPSIEETNSLYAQGGIIYEAASQDPEVLIRDVLEAGAGLNHLPAVEQLAKLGPETVRRFLFERADVPFDKSGDGSFHLTKEAAHSESRILHHGDESGRVIEKGLVGYCRGLSKITMVPQTTAINLLMTSFHAIDRSQLHEPARCFGAFVFDQATREVYPIFAEHTVLATGGVGQLYVHNTNSRCARGDGIALAHRAGCRLDNLEYIQFHPTTFYFPNSPRFLISEAMRGEGAVLINQAGERFLEKYLPEYAVPELAPRDKVARAIHHEMLNTDTQCVYLDVRHKPKGWAEERFPFIYRSLMTYGLDPAASPIPVVPAAHYLCGGIWTDLQGKTSISNLWATGETACTGLHGANRLASTSLLESLVWGSQAGKAIAEDLKKPQPVIPEIYPWDDETSQVDPGFLHQDWFTLKHTMWNYVGLIKTEARLRRAEGILNELSRGIEAFYQKAALSDELIGLRHAALVCQLILQASQRNPRSRGCYLREELEI